MVSLAPLPGNIQLKIVQSGSMEPVIPTGSLVVVKPADSYIRGDVITFGADTKTQVPTTHRIVDIQPGASGVEYVTKGDANKAADPVAASANEVIGKVVVTIPYFGFILDFARQPLGFAVLIGIPALLVVIDEVANIYREVRKLRPVQRERTAGTRAPQVARRREERDEAPRTVSAPVATRLTRPKVRTNQLFDGISRTPMARVEPLRQVYHNAVVQGHQVILR